MSSSPNLLTKFKNSIKHKKSSSSTGTKVELEDEQILHLLESSYIEGQKHAEVEFGKKVKKYGWSDPKQSKYYHDLIHEAYQEGQKSYHSQHPHDKNVIVSTTKGQLLSTPPKINRKPVDKGMSGDFANEKHPIDDSLVDESKLYRNDIGHYGNDASTKQGTGYFFDPKDTQGGYYGTDDNDTQYNEATRAKLEQERKLKTQPSANHQVDDGTNTGDDKNVTGDNKNVKTDDAGDNYHDDGTFVKQIDPTSEHENNKSVYNPEGIKSVLDNSGVTSGKDAQPTKSGSGAAGAAAATGAAAVAGAAGYAALNKHKANDKSLNDKSLNHKSSGNSYDDIKPNLTDHKPNETDLATQNENVEKDLNLQEGGAGVPPSSNAFNYDEELKRVDQNIDNTKSRLNTLQAEDNASTTAIKSPNTEAPPSNSLDDHSSSKHSTAKNIGILGGVTAGTAAAIEAARRLAGFDTAKNPQDSDIPEVKQAYQEGIISGSYDAGKTAYHEDKSSHNGANTNSSTANADTNLDNANSKTLDPKVQAYEEGVKSGAYDAGTSDATKDTAVDNKSHSSSTGLFAGAAGAIGAAGAVAAGALGFGSPSKSSTVDESSILKEAYEAGKIQAQKDHYEQGGKSIKSAKSNISNNSSIGDSPVAPDLKEIDSEYEGDDDDLDVKDHGISGSAGAAAAGAAAGATAGATASAATSSSADHSKATSAGTVRDPNSLVDNVANYPDVADKPQHIATKKVEDSTVTGVPTTSGTAAETHKEKSQDLSSSVDNKSKEGLNAASGTQNSKDSKPDSTDDGESTGSSKKGFMAGAIGAAAGVLGYGAYKSVDSDDHNSSFNTSETGDHNKNLIDQAAAHHKDVDNAPSYGKGGVSNKDIKNEIGINDAELKSSKATATSEREHAKEDAINNYNGNQGFKSSNAKPLIDVVDADHPNSKKLNSTDEQNKAVNSQNSDGNSDLAKGAAIGGVVGAGTAAGAAATGLSKRPFNKDGNYSDDDLNLKNELKEYYAAGYEKGSYDAGYEKGSYKAGHERATNEHAKSKSAAAGGVGAAGSDAPGEQGSDSSLIVEVIGVDDEKVAARLAKKASKELKAQGVDLSSGKLVINAETKEVFKIDDDSTTRHDSINISSPVSPNSSKFDSESDSNAKAKERLSAAANASTLSKKNKNDEAARNAGTAALAGVAGAAAAGTAYAGLKHADKNKELPETSDARAFNGNDHAANVTSETNPTRGTEPASVYDKQATSSNTEPDVSSGVPYKGNIKPNSEHDYSNQRIPGAATGAIGAGAAVGTGSAAIAHDKTKSVNPNTGAQTVVSEKAQPIESPAKSDSDIVVTVHGGNDAEAGRIAERIVKSLRGRPEILSTVKEIRINAVTGVVTDENGKIIAREPIGDTATPINESKGSTTVNPSTSTKVDHHNAAIGATTGAAIGAAGVAGVAGSSIGKHSDKPSPSSNNKGASANITKPLDPESNEEVYGDKSIAETTHNSKNTNPTATSQIHDDPTVIKGTTNQEDHFRHSVGPHVTHDRSGIPEGNSSYSKDFNTNESVGDGLTKGDVAATGAGGLGGATLGDNAHSKDINPQINSPLSNEPEIKKGGSVEDHFHEDTGPYTTNDVKDINDHKRHTTDTNDGSNKAGLAAGLAAGGIGATIAGVGANSYYKDHKAGLNKIETDSDTSKLNPTPENSKIDDTIAQQPNSSVVGYDASNNKDLQKTPNSGVVGYDASNDKDINDSSSTASPKKDKKKSLFGFLSRSKSTKDSESKSSKPNKADNKAVKPEAKAAAIAAAAGGAAGGAAGTTNAHKSGESKLNTDSTTDDKYGTNSGVDGTSGSGNLTTQVDTSRAQAQGSSVPSNYNANAINKSRISDPNAGTGSIPVIAGVGAVGAASAAGAAALASSSSSKNNNIGNLESLETSAKERIHESNQAYDSNSSSSLVGNKKSSQYDDSYYGYTTSNVGDGSRGVAHGNHGTIEDPSLVRGKQANDAIPRRLNDITVEVVGCSTSDQEKLQLEKQDLIRNHPELIPTSTNKITFDAKTGIAYDGTGNQISGLSSSRSLVDGEKLPQENKIEMPGSFFN